MNANEIMNNAIGYSTPELDKIKSEMVTVIDKMIAYIPTLKSQGMTEIAIRANIDTTLRRVMAKLLNGKTSYIVVRDGKQSIMGLSHTTSDGTANYIVAMTQAEASRIFSK